TAEPSSTNDASSSPVNAAKTSQEHLFDKDSNMFLLVLLNHLLLMMLHHHQLMLLLSERG
ncbi:hypothetical protein Tco_0687213, partial [Tanacetum coccineum]